MTLSDSLSPRRWLFVLTILVGSFLLFQVQPMVARMVLPKLGGAPAVWNSAMLVYQALLLGGYAYAHWLGRFDVRRQAIIHVALFLVAALWLPIGIAHIAPPGAGQEALWVPLLLLASIGPVFFVVSAQAPLMQRWFAADARAGDPYYLYAASNLGSFAGLISYPALVEPSLPLAAQSWGWTAGYALLVLLVAACAAARWQGRVTDPAVDAAATDEPRPTWRRQLHWLLIAAVPSGLMLSTTTHLTTDIVAMPLLWVLPLGLYLLSFVIAFSTMDRLTEVITFIAPAVLLAVGGLALWFGNSVEAAVILGGLVTVIRKRHASVHNSSWGARGSVIDTGVVAVGWKEPVQRCLFFGSDWAVVVLGRVCRVVIFRIVRRAHQAVGDDTCTKSPHYGQQCQHTLPPIGPVAGPLTIFRATHGMQ